MRVLVTWGSRRGGTEGVGRTLGEALQAHGHEVTANPAQQVRSLDGFDAVVLGGALYANCWPAVARRFVDRHLRRLRAVPVWLFSSGPLDASADSGEIPATTQVAVIAERVGAVGHVTFGGRLAPDAKGFPASAMAKKRSGDWRNPEQIRAWAAELAAALPTASPRTPIDHPARSLRRLLAHGLVGWALCAAAMAALLSLVGLNWALALHAILAPAFFVSVARRYFRARGARDPLPTAVAWTAVVVLLDLVLVAGVIQRSLEMFTSVVGTWLPFGLIFLATWVTGEVMYVTAPQRTPGPAGQEQEAGDRRTAP